MKPLQIGLLVLVGALGGALIMKFTQRPKPAGAPVANAVPVPSAAPAVPEAPAPVAENLPPAVTPAPAEPEKPAEPAPAQHPVHRARVARPVPPPVTVAQNLPPAQPNPAPAAPPIPVQEPVAPPISNDPAPPVTPEPSTQPVGTPPPAAEPAPSVTLQAGMVLPIRLGESLSSEHNQAGDTFTGTLDAPLTAGGYVIAERGAHVEGRVIAARKSGHGSSKAILSLELTKLDTSDGQHVVIKTDTLKKQGATMASGDQVGVVAAAAGIGAIIGALAGGGKGAAIGAGAGGAAGGGGVLATRDKAVSLPVETKLSFRLSNAITLTERANQ